MDPLTLPYRERGERRYEHRPFDELGANAIRDGQLVLTGDLVVNEYCGGPCVEAGHPPGSPYPHVGSFVPGWDSHAPLSWIYEDPSACNLVPVDDTIPINEFNWGATQRRSDTCDYLMQCMYEENSVIALDKPFWFHGLDKDIIFYLTMAPSDIEPIAEGFCFPDDDAELEPGDCDGKEYFAVVEEMHIAQHLRFMRILRYMKQVDQNSYPMHVQFELKYWQRTALKKEVIDGRVILEEFERLRDVYSESRDPYGENDVQKTWGVRGRQYDLRINMYPVDWMAVLNAFALAPMTYIIFYFVTDGGMIVCVMCARRLTRTRPCAKG